MSERRIGDRLTLPKAMFRSCHLVTPVPERADGLDYLFARGGSHTGVAVQDARDCLMRNAWRALRQVSLVRAVAMPRITVLERAGGTPGSGAVRVRRCVVVVSSMTASSTPAMSANSSITSRLSAVVRTVWCAAPAVSQHAAEVGRLGRAPRLPVRPAGSVPWRQLVGVVLHQRGTARQPVPHHLRRADQDRGLPVPFGAEAVPLRHQPLHGEAGKLP